MSPPVLSFGSWNCGSISGDRLDLLVEDLEAVSCSAHAIAL